jgi:DNA topoisomerase-1
VAHDFKPKYVVPPKSKKIIAELKDAAEKSSAVILATDEDREGEAIAWHLTQALGLGISNFQFPISNKIPNSKFKTSENKNLKPETRNLKPVQRIVFHEITRPAIEEALKNPRGIDMNLVDAQQARRVLDRLVGRTRPKRCLAISR